MAEQQYLVFETSSNKIAINLNLVLEVIRMPKWTPYPNASDYIKGIFNLRNNIIPLIDFRKLLGYQTFEHEINDLIDMLKLREQDHINWLNELDLCVKERREFRLVTDAQKCKFGQWYYSFNTNNVVLKNFLDQFEEPHKLIHHKGITVNELMSQKKYDDAEKVITQARQNEFKKMINLFNELYGFLKSSIREFVVIINSDKGVKSFTVDKIDQIIKVADSDISSLDNAELKGTAKEVIKRDKDIILKLDIQTLLDKI